MDGKTITAIIKQPGERFGHTAKVLDKLETYQNTVGGYIETLPVEDTGALIICCEEGKLARMPFNIYYQRGDDTIVGTIMVVGTDGDEFADCPLTLGDWKQILRRWGN